MTIQEPISRRTVLAAGLGAVGATWLRPAAGQAAEGVDPRLTRLLADSLPIDMHNHVYPAGISERQQRFAGGSPVQPGQAPATLNLADELRAAGLTGVCASYELDFTPINKPGDARDNYLRWIDALDRQLEREGLRRALSLRDRQAARTSRRSAVIHTVEGAQFIEGRLERIEEVYRRGLRHLQLLHDRDDLVMRLSDTDNGRDDSGGLTPFGRDVIKECNRLGILVDLAHGSPETIRAAAKIATVPFIVSHTGAAGSIPAGARTPGNLLPRLFDRERARVVVDAGGVIGAWVYPVDSVEQYVRNIRALVTLAGADHVGIGSGSNILSPQPGKGTNRVWPGQRAGFFPTVAAEMLRQGFTPDEIARIGGGNYCRVFDRATSQRG